MRMIERYQHDRCALCVVLRLGTLLKASSKSPTSFSSFMFMACDCVCVCMSEGHALVPQLAAQLSELARQGKRDAVKQLFSSDSTSSICQEKQ